MNAEQLELLRIQNIYKSIHTKIQTDFKAIVVSRFSQSTEPVNSFLKIGGKDTSGGICQALVNRWIAAHANGGSLWNELYTQVGQLSCLKIDAMKGLVSEFARGLGSSKTSMGPYQKLNSEVFLMQRGVIPRMEIASGHRQYQEGYRLHSNGEYRSSDPNLGKKIVNALAAVRPFGFGEGSYAMISIKGKGGGHVMSAYLGGAGKGANKKYPYSDVAFFDPNIGEYWFDSGKNFADFLGYLMTLLYKDFAGFQIRSFGVAAAHMQGHRSGGELGRARG